MKPNILLSILAVCGPVVAFWRMECRGLVGIGRIDPIMSPGAVAQHAHTIQGSGGFGLSTDYKELNGANCTSCVATQDMSSYWAPVMYFKHANGSFGSVTQAGGMLAYYFLGETLGTTNITAFPAGFRMIAGDSTRRNYTITGMDASSVYAADPAKSFWAELNQTSQYDLEQRALGFNCLNYAKTPEGSLQRHYLPDKNYLDANCMNGIRLELAFPNCWNGKDLDSANHKDHMKYPNLVLNGDCPAGFETRVPGLFYETIWNTQAFVGVDGEFVISNGDVNGFGYHGDFMTGWNVDILQNAINTCTSLSGTVEDCPVFTLQSTAVMAECTMATPAALVDEPVQGMIGDHLPGNVAIQTGPGPALGGPTVNQTDTSTGTVTIPSVGYIPGTSVSGGGVGGIFIQSTTTSFPTPSQVATPTSSSTSSTSSTTCPETAPSTTAKDQDVVPTPAPTTTPPATQAGEPGMQTSFSTEYKTNGNVVSEIIWEDFIVYVTEEEDVVVTVTDTGGVKNRRHLHQHQHHHRHRQVPK